MISRIPSRSLARFLLMSAAVGTTMTSFALADDLPSYAGDYSGNTLQVTLSASAGGYSGTIKLGANQFPAKATASAQGLAGSFSASGTDYPFTATLNGEQLTLISGGKTYMLTRPATAASSGTSSAGNPLGDTIKSPSQSAESQMFGAFHVLGANKVGQTLFIRLPGAITLESAITQTADAFASVCDGKPSVSGAFAEAQAKDKGGASLDAKMKGEAVHGLIFCNGGPQGGSATVIVAPPNISKADFATLIGFMPAPLKMEKHVFPDKSGSIDLPDGWITPSTSATYGIVAKGPAGQAVVIGNTQEMYTPDCRLVRNARQNYQMQLNNYNNQERAYGQAVEMHRRFPNTVMPRQPVPPVSPDADPNVMFPKLSFCRQCDGAEDVLKTWYPIAEERQRHAGGPYTLLDQIIEVVPADPNPLIAGSKSGVALIAVTDHVGDTTTPVRVITRITTAPIMANECWQLTATNMRAPAATFDRDVTVMNAIINSVTLNMDVVNKQISDAGAAVRKMGADSEQQLLKRGRDFQNAQAEQFNNFESQIAAQEKAVHDSSSDYIEYIRGVRDVYDNATGKMIDVDLFHSDAIVGGLNTLAQDPNRFVQIPLRYER